MPNPNCIEFQELIEELKDTDGALVPEIQRLTVSQHWYLGSTIYNSKFYTMYGENKQSIAQIAEARNVSASTVYKEIKFYVKFPMLELAPGEIDIDFIASLLPAGKHPSWSYIANHLLGNVEEEPKSARLKVSRKVYSGDLPKIIDDKNIKFVTLYDSKKHEIEVVELC